MGGDEWLSMVGGENGGNRGRHSGMVEGAFLMVVSIVDDEGWNDEDGKARKWESEKEKERKKEREGKNEGREAGRERETVSVGSVIASDDW